MTISAPTRMNARRRITGSVQIGSFISRALLARLDALAKDRGIPRSQLVRELLILGAYANDR